MKIESLQKLASQPSARHYASLINIKNSIATWTNGFSMFQLTIPSVPFGDGVFTKDLLPAHSQYPAYDSVIPTDLVELPHHSLWLSKALTWSEAFKTSMAGKYCIAISDMGASMYPVDTNVDAIATCSKFSCEQLQLLAGLCKANKILVGSLTAYRSKNDDKCWIIKNSEGTFRAVLMGIK